MNPFVFKMVAGLVALAFIGEALYEEIPSEKTKPKKNKTDKKSIRTDNEDKDENAGTIGIAVPALKETTEVVEKEVEPEKMENAA